MNEHEIRHKERSYKEELDWFNEKKKEKAKRRYKVWLYTKWIFLLSFAPPIVLMFIAITSHIDAVSVIAFVATLCHVIVFNCAFYMSDGLIKVFYPKKYWGYRTVNYVSSAFDLHYQKFVLDKDKSYDETDKEKYRRIKRERKKMEDFLLWTNRLREDPDYREAFFSLT